MCHTILVANSPDCYHDNYVTLQNATELAFPNGPATRAGRAVICQDGLVFDLCNSTSYKEDIAQQICNNYASGSSKC